MPTLLDKNALIYPKADKTPVNVITDYFKKEVKKPGDKVLLLQASTGAGKSSALPYAIFKSNEYLNGRICLTQPTRINVIDIATKMHKESWNTLEMGETVGFQTGLSSNRPAKRHSIIYMTAGILLQQLKTSDEEMFMKKYSYIILDEVHTRSINIDMCIFLISSVIKRNYKNELCPNLILMSATFNLKKYINYFNGCGHVIVSGINFPITSNYLKVSSTNKMQDVINIIEKISQEDLIKEGNDVLVFGSTFKELDELVTRAKKTLDKSILSVMLTGSTYSAYHKDVADIFKDIKETGYTRRVIFSTNVAETGITFEQLRYVIDLGYRNTVEYDPYLNCAIQLVKPVTQGMATQRKGRVGRLFNGEWYPLYTEESFKTMQEDQHPAIVADDNSTVLLTLVCYFENFKLDMLTMLDNPPSESLFTALNKLYTLGMIESDSASSIMKRTLKPTAIGLVANDIRKVSIENIKMILSGFAFDVNILDLCTIAAFIESGFSLPLNHKYWNHYLGDAWEVEQYTIEIADTFTVILRIYDVIKKKIKTKSFSVWCAENKYSPVQIIGILNLRDEIIISILKHFEVNHGSNSLEGLKHCFYEGYKCNLLTWDGEQYKNNMNIKVEKSVVMSKLGFYKKEVNPPKYVITNKIKFVEHKFSKNTSFYYDIDYVSVLDGFVL